jgi:hypothetical protein
MAKKKITFKIGCENSDCRAYVELKITPAKDVEITYEHAQEIIVRGGSAIDTKQGAENYWLETNNSKCVDGGKHNFSVIRTR